MYLLDTNVVSELRNVWCRYAYPSVLTWTGRDDAGQFFVSAISLLDCSSLSCQSSGSTPHLSRLLSGRARRSVRLYAPPNGSDSLS